MSLGGFGGFEGFDRISVCGVRAFGHHGLLPAERARGQEFVVDVVIHTDTRHAAREDSIDATVDYAAVASLVEDLITGQSHALVEALAEAIASALLELDRVDMVDVRVHKPAAPIPVRVDDVAVLIRRVR